MWLDNVWVFITVPNFQSEVSRQYFLEQKIGTIKSNSIGDLLTVGSVKLKYRYLDYGQLLVGLAAAAVRNLTIDIVRNVFLWI